MRTLIVRVEFLADDDQGERYLGALYRETPDGLDELPERASFASHAEAAAHVARVLPAVVAEGEAIVVDGMTFTRAAWRAAVNHLANIPPYRDGVRR